jgi:hypothetical protein
MTTSTSYTLPTSLGVPGELNLITTDGFGNLYWTDPTKGISLYWTKINEVITTTGDWGLGHLLPIFGGTTKTHLLFGRGSVTTSGEYNSILNGVSNTASANYVTIFTGNTQSVSGNYSTALGGSNNTISASNSILFGKNNTISAANSIIEGGQETTISAAGTYVFKGDVTPQSISTANLFAPLDIQFHFNESNNDADFRVDGTDLMNPVLYMDASADGVAIGNNSAVAALDVYNGNMALTTTGAAKKIMLYEPSGGVNYSSFSPSSQTYNLEYVLPPEHNLPNSILINDGNGNLSWADPGTFAEYLRAKVVVIDEAKTYDATVYDNYIIIRTAGNCRINLPLASTMSGKEVLIKKGNFTGGRVDIVPTPPNLVDGLTSIYINQVYEGVFLVCDGLAWYVMSKYVQ